MGLGAVPSLDGDRDLAAGLEPGDIVFCRTSGNWLSRLISRLDGYWCHAALYVGDGQVAEASSHGMQFASLDKLAGRYPDGLAMGRPHDDHANKDDRAAAAKEATCIVNETEGTRYSGFDLGLAAALLARAGPAESLDAALETDEDAVAEEALERIASGTEFASTCSGLVYSSFKDGPKIELDIVPAPGIKLDDEGRFVLPAAVDLLGWLRDPAADEFDDRQEGIRDMLAIGRILADASLGVASTLLKDRVIDPEVGVTPADLWCSPMLQARFFLTASYKAVADQESAPC